MSSHILKHHKREILGVTLLSFKYYGLTPFTMLEKVPWNTQI